MIIALYRLLLQYFYCFVFPKYFICNKQMRAHRIFLFLAPLTIMFSLFQVIVQYDQLDIIMHPVFQRLLHVKWNLFGKRGSAKILALNFLLTIIWTVLGIFLPRDFHYYLPLAENWWRPTMEALGILIIVQLIKMVGVIINSSPVFQS